jgi:hypothetical protein
MFGMIGMREMREAARGKPHSFQIGVYSASPGAALAEALIQHTGRLLGMQIIGFCRKA